jgi:tryptophanyl-tRNA synthetase
MIGVPVGHDQTQHLELANDIVRRFNLRYDARLPEVKPILTPTARIMSLKDPTRKMSKSLGGDHCLFLDDSPEEVERKLRSAVTDTKPTADSRQPIAAGMSPGVRTLFEILETFGESKVIQKFREAHDAGTVKYSELKPVVAQAYSQYFADFRMRKAELLADPEQIDAALTAGAETARAVARETLQMVRERVGIR